MNAAWTSAEDVAARVKRRWDDGSLLRSYANAEPFAPIEVPLRGPTLAQIGDDIAAARDWVVALDGGRGNDVRYALEWKTVGGRQIGRNAVPIRAVVSSYEQAWTLLGVVATVRRFDRLLTLTAQHKPVRDWIASYPHRALSLVSEMPRLVAAYEWLDGHRHSQRYLRELSASGVDTKFAERYRSDLAGMLGVSSSPGGFLADLGLRAKPSLLRLRLSSSLGLPVPLTEVAARTDELAQLDVQPHVALIIENEISYLSAAVPPNGVVIWGKGFDVDNAGKLQWLAGADVIYWGDIDTHGFAILDRLRAWLPSARSVLMDRETLLTHRDRWVSEDRPAKSLLTRLTADEYRLYSELVEGGLGDGVRLEQERVDWSWVEQRLRLAQERTAEA